MHRVFFASHRILSATARCALMSAAKPRIQRDNAGISLPGGGRWGPKYDTAHVIRRTADRRWFAQACSRPSAVRARCKVVVNGKAAPSTTTSQLMQTHVGSIAMRLRDADSFPSEPSGQD